MRRTRPALLTAPALTTPALILWAAAALAISPVPARAAGFEMVPMPDAAPAAAAGVVGVPALPAVQTPGGHTRAAAPAPTGIGFTGTDGQITVQLGHVLAPLVVPHRQGVQLRFHGHADLDLAGLRQLPGVLAATAWQERGDTVLEIHSRTGRLESRLTGDSLLLGTARSLAKTDANPAPSGRNAPSQAELEALRQSVASKLAALNSLPGPATTDQPGPGTAGSPQSGSPQAGGMTSPMPGVAVSAGSPDASSAAPPAPPRLLLSLCEPINFADWKGKGDFAVEDARRRGKLARNPDDLRAVAALARFYVVHGLAAEALVLTDSWDNTDPTLPGSADLLQARDIARLIRRTPIPAGSALLQPSSSCERTDLGLWQALQASAQNDAATVNANARRARAALGDVPEPLRTILAVNIADGSNENAETLRAMVSATRNSVGGPPEDATSRWLLQARVAQAENNTNDEQLFLERAAQDQDSVPGLFARVRLAGMQLRRPGGEATRAERFLQDTARTYRRDQLGEEAALILARHRLSENDFANALQLADAATNASRQGSESRGARLAADLLRQLLVDPKGATLPPAAERITLFWHYEGYATPGERGDDIRIGAANLLLKQGFPDAAVDMARQLSPATMQTAAGIDIRARTEAIAATGDPQVALALLHNQPDSTENSRITARALSRLGHAEEAAQALANATDVTDRNRRAELLYAADLWPEAASAYADLLRDPALGRDQRAEATRRYALSVSLARTPPSNPPPSDLLAPDDMSGRLLAVATPAPPQPADAPPVASVRDAISRARQIETLLNP